MLAECNVAFRCYRPEIGNGHAKRLRNRHVDCSQLPICVFNGRVRGNVQFTRHVIGAHESILLRKGGVVDHLNVIYAAGKRSVGLNGAIVKIRGPRVVVSRKVGPSGLVRLGGIGRVYDFSIHNYLKTIVKIPTTIYIDDVEIARSHHFGVYAFSLILGGYVSQRRVGLFYCVYVGVLYAVYRPVPVCYNELVGQVRLAAVAAQHGFGYGKAYFANYIETADSAGFLLVILRNGAVFDRRLHGRFRRLIVYKAVSHAEACYLRPISFRLGGGQGYAAEGQQPCHEQRGKQHGQ